LKDKSEKEKIENMGKVEEKIIEEIDSIAV